MWGGGDGRKGGGWGGYGDDEPLFERSADAYDTCRIQHIKKIRQTSPEARCVRHGEVRHACRVRIPPR